MTTISRRARSPCYITIYSTLGLLVWLCTSGLNMRSCYNFHCNLQQYSGPASMSLQEWFESLNIHSHSMYITVYLALGLPVWVCSSGLNMRSRSISIAVYSILALPEWLCSNGFHLYSHSIYIAVLQSFGLFSAALQ